MKRTPLARSRKPIQRRSEKMEAKYAGPDGRRALVRRLLAERPNCEASVTQYAYGLSPLTGLEYTVRVCTGQSQDIHELLRRSAGGSITDVSNLLAVCRACHTWITDNPEEAEALGLSKRRWPKGETQ